MRFVSVGRTTGLLFALVLTLVTLWGCGGASTGEDGDRSTPRLEEVVVGGPPDSTLTTETDQKARVVGDPGVAGVIPGGFPEGLPLYQPSSVVDFGGEAGNRYVLFRAQDPPNVVRVGLLAEWEQAGWRHEGGETYRRGAQRVILSLDGVGPATEIRIGY